jgi:thiol-disulfide isomerase/thioredoxin
MLKEFFGQECGHCLAMNPLIARLEKETGLTVEKIETWHNEENETQRASFDKGQCGGVPFFVNTDTGAVLCGEVPYAELVAWATGTHQ